MLKFSQFYSKMLNSFRKLSEIDAALLLSLLEFRNSNKYVHCAECICMCVMCIRVFHSCLHLTADSRHSDIRHSTLLILLVNRFRLNEYQHFAVN